MFKLHTLSLSLSLSPSALSSSRSPELPSHPKPKTPNPPFPPQSKAGGSFKLVEDHLLHVLLPGVTWNLKFFVGEKSI